MGTPPHKSLRVLFADDEASLQEFMRTELPRLGHEVTVCPDGKSAIKAFEKTHFDAAILDLRMPGLDGIQVLEQLKQISPDTEAVMIYVYGPAGDVAHWRQELEGTLPKAGHPPTPPLPAGAAPQCTEKPKA